MEIEIGDGVGAEIGAEQKNIGAAAVQLTPDDLAKIDNASAKIRVEGARYPENLQKLVNR